MATMEDSKKPEDFSPRSQEDTDTILASERATAEQPYNHVSPPQFAPNHRTYNTRFGQVLEGPETRRSTARLVTTLSDPAFLGLIRDSSNSESQLASLDNSPESTTSSDSTDAAIRTLTPPSPQKPLPRIPVIDADDYVWLQQGTLPYSLLAQRLNLAQMEATSRWGRAVGATANNLLSTFQDIWEEERQLVKPGQKMNEKQTFEDGFDATLFSLWCRADPEKRQLFRPLLPWRLRGDFKTSKLYRTVSGSEIHRQQAWMEVCAVFHEAIASASMSPEFELIANDFFSGREVLETYDIDTPLNDGEDKPYFITPNGGDRAKVLSEKPLNERRLAVFLEDVAMANDYEKSCKTMTEIYGHRIYRHASYKDTMARLQKAQKSSEFYRVVDLDSGNVRQIAGNFDLDDFLTSIGASSAIDSEVENPIPAPNTPGDSSTFKFASPGQTSTTEDASAGLVDLSADIPRSLSANKKSRANLVKSSSAILLNPKSTKITTPKGESAKSDNHKVSSTSVESEDVPVEEAESPPNAKKGPIRSKESNGKKKKKTHTKRKVSQNGKGPANVAQSSSSQVDEDPELDDDANVDEFVKLKEVQPDSPTETVVSPIPEDEDDEGWNKVKSKSSAKSKGLKNTTSNAPPAIRRPTNVAASAPAIRRPVRAPPAKRTSAKAQTPADNGSRAFKPEEYPALAPSSSKVQSPSNTGMRKLTPDDFPAISAGILKVKAFDGSSKNGANNSKLQTNSRKSSTSSMLKPEDAAANPAERESKSEESLISSPNGSSVKPVKTLADTTTTQAKPEKQLITLSNPSSVKAADSPANTAAKPQAENSVSPNAYSVKPVQFSAKTTAKSKPKKHAAASQKIPSVKLADSPADTVAKPKSKEDPVSSPKTSSAAPADGLAKTTTKSKSKDPPSMPSTSSVKPTAAPVQLSSEQVKFQSSPTQVKLADSTAKIDENSVELSNTSAVEPKSCAVETEAGEFIVLEDEQLSQSSSFCPVTSTTGPIDTVLLTIEDPTLPAVRERSFTENLSSLPAAEVEALRILAQESQNAIDPPLSEVYGDVSGTVVEYLADEITISTDLQGTGLEWASDLTSPTKYNSGWRHSSLPRQSPTPSEDDFDDSIEISTERPRSNSAVSYQTAIQNPRVRRLQFGDMPIPVFEDDGSEEPVVEMPPLPVFRAAESQTHTSQSQGGTSARDEPDSEEDEEANFKWSFTTHVRDPRVLKLQFGNMPVPTFGPNGEEVFFDENGEQIPSQTSQEGPNESLGEKTPVPQTASVSASDAMAPVEYQNQDMPIPVHMPPGNPPPGTLPPVQVLPGQLPPGAMPMTQNLQVLHMTLPPFNAPFGPGYAFSHPNPRFLPNWPVPGLPFPQNHFAPDGSPLSAPPIELPLTARTVPYNPVPQVVEQPSQSDGESTQRLPASSVSNQSTQPPSVNDPSTTSSVPHRQPPPAEDSIPPEPFRCTWCQVVAIPTVTKPLFFCPGCGPDMPPRYCSSACLLAHSFYHAENCAQYAAWQRLFAHAMPKDIYEYEENYLAPSGYDRPDPSERHRQRLFAIYCNKGAVCFPPVLKAWAKTQPLPVGLPGFDLEEMYIKKTGDYYIFRSEISADGRAFCPVEVIATIKLGPGSLMREALSRCLNASLHVINRHIVRFLFRLLSDVIRDPERFDAFVRTTLQSDIVYEEFRHQFSREFKCNTTEYERETSARFFLQREWTWVRQYLEQMETGEHRILQLWFLDPPDIPIGYLVKSEHDSIVPNADCRCYYCRALVRRRPAPEE